MIKRERDILTGNEDLETLAIIQEFPVYMGVTEQDAGQDLCVDMEWGISAGSGMVQLLKLVPEEILYHDSHNNSIGKMWMQHHEQFSDFIREFRGGILEAGGGNGILNAVYTAKYGNIGWTIVEPSRVHMADGCRAEYIYEFWENSLDTVLHSVRYDTLVHSHMMEHQYDLDKFMLHNRRILKEGQRMVFSVPNIREWVRRKYSNALNFEHTYLISDEYVELLLKNYGFRVIEKRFFREDHSIFYAVEKVNMPVMETGISVNAREWYETNKSLLMDYIRYFKETVRQINYRLAERKGKVYLFGAHIFSQMLISIGLDVSRIACILDNDLYKQGKRLYGTSFYVSSPVLLKDVEKPVVILKAGAYTDEIKNDILTNINSKTEFWT